MQAKDDKERYKTEMANYNPPAGSKVAKSAGGKKVEKKKKDPNAPKRGLSSFMFFSNELRPKLKEEQPDLSFGELVSNVFAKQDPLRDLLTTWDDMGLIHPLFDVEPHRVRRLEQDSGL